MPTFHDPRADAAEASDALRGLAHASRVFDSPADTYQVAGELVAGVRSLRQVINQLAAAHLAHRDIAFHDDGDHDAGARSAAAAADELHRAGTLLDDVHERLNTALTHSGRIAWRPDLVTAGLDDTAATPSTARAGALILTVWPDNPLGDHQRYAYRITEATSGRELTGRDLFTGTGEPVDPAHAIQELAGYLAAAGEARQRGADHLEVEPGHEGLFPDWVADAARRDADALAGLAGFSEQTSAPEAPGPARRWVNVVFLQGDEADEVLDLIDRDGTAAAIDHLTAWDYGNETTDAAMVNGYVYDEPPTGALDRAATDDDGRYMLTYNPSIGYVSLLRRHTVPPADALTGPGDRNIVPARGQVADASAPASAEQSAVAGRRLPDTSWFDHPDTAAADRPRGLSL